MKGFAHLVLFISYEPEFLELLNPRLNLKRAEIYPSFPLDYLTTKPQIWKPSQQSISHTPLFPRPEVSY
jgi:hypothetical protein